MVVSLSYGRDGKHNPDISGRYVHNPNDGKYIPDNSGQYIPDYSGLYYYDGSGIYKSDGTGYYKADKDGNFRDKNGEWIRSKDFFMFIVSLDDWYFYIWFLLMIFTYNS